MRLYSADINKKSKSEDLDFLMQMTITDLLKYIFHGVIIHILSRLKKYIQRADI